MSFFSAPALELWVRELLVASNVPDDQALQAAGVFLRATMRGLGHHDISYLPQRLTWLANHQVNARPQLRRLSESAATEVWDGDGGLGEVLCSHITYRAMDLAAQSGLGYAAVRHSNHFLAAAPYAELGAERGFLIVVWSNTDAGMAFPGGTSRQIGNNPIGFGVGNGESYLGADLCLAYSSLGQLMAMDQAGHQTPSHWGVDAHGQPTTDPRELLQGAVRPIAGHKGLALALLGEVLTGGLSGGPTLDEILPGGGLKTHSQMVLAWNLENFGGSQVMQERLLSIKERARQIGHTSRLPGDRSREAERQALVHGVPIGAAILDQLTHWSEKLQVTMPKPL